MTATTTTWLLFAGFLASGIITAITLKKSNFRIALPLYLFAFGFLSMYIPFFSGCSLIIRLSSFIMPDMLYRFFVEAITCPLSASLPFATSVYFAYIALSVGMIIAVALVAVFTVRAVLSIIDKCRREGELPRPPKKLNTLSGSCNEERNEPKLSRLCRLNC